MSAAAYPKIFRFYAGAICLDFLNTTHWPLGRRTELFESYDKLLEWGQLAGLLSKPQCKRLRLSAAPTQTRRALNDAIAFRDAAETLMRAQLAGRNPPAAAVHVFNTRLAVAGGHYALRRTARGFVREHTEPDTLLCLIDPVVESLAALLTSPNATRIGACERCDWLFLDTTRNHSRRWCAMASCGIHEKSARYYRKRVANQEQTGV